jgi:hypothetical protein
MRYLIAVVCLLVLPAAMHAQSMMVVDSNHSGPSVLQPGSIVNIGMMPSAGMTLKFRIVSNESTDLEISNISTLSESGCTVNITAQPAALLPKGTSGMLELEVTPHGLMSLSFNVRIETNVVNVPEFLFRVEAVAGDPQIAISRAGTPVPHQGTDNLGRQIRSSFPLRYDVGNAGNAPLQVRDVLLSNTFNCTVAIVGSSTGSVQPAQSGLLQFEVTPAVYGIIAFQVTVRHNIPWEPAYRFQVQADVNEARIEVLRDTTVIPDQGMDSFGSIPNVTSLLEFRIRNAGSLNLMVDPPVLTGAVNCAVQVETAPTVVGTGAERTLMVSVTPLGLGPVSFAVTLNTNSARLPVYTFEVHGQTRDATLELYRGLMAVPDGFKDNLGETGLSRRFLTYDITNGGNEPLVLGQASFADVFNTAVDFLTPPPATVAPGTTEIFRIEVTPQSSGPYGFHVLLPNNVAIYPDFCFKVEGEAGEPEMQLVREGAVVPSGFVDYAEGTLIFLEYTIRNVGNRNLDVGAVIVEDEYNCGATIATLPAQIVPPGAETDFLIVVQPNLPGPFEFRVSIYSSNPGVNPYVFEVEGLMPDNPPSESIGVEPNPGSNSGCITGRGGQPWFWAAILVLTALALRTQTRYKSRKVAGEV